MTIIVYSWNKLETQNKWRSKQYLTRLKKGKTKPLNEVLVPQVNATTKFRTKTQKEVQIEMLTTQNEQNKTTHG